MDRDLARKQGKGLGSYQGVKNIKRIYIFLFFFLNNCLIHEIF